MLTSTQLCNPVFCSFLLSFVYKLEDTISFLCNFVLFHVIDFFPVGLIKLKLAYVHLFSVCHSNPDDVLLFLRIVDLLETYCCRMKERSKAYGRERWGLEGPSNRAECPLISWKESGH